MTVTVHDLLDEADIRAMLGACRSSRDRAMVMTLYEGRSAQHGAGHAHLGAAALL
jgi:hypothetical protein